MTTLNEGSSACKDNCDSATSTSRIELLLASMRAASSNLQTWKLEIDAIGVALKGGSISIEEACERLAALGLLAWLPGGNQHG